jgi:hypothetical protein
MLPSPTLLQRLRDVLPAPGEGTMEQRLFRMACLTGMVLCLGVYIPLDRLAGLSVWMDVGVGAFGLVAALLYLLARRGHYLNTTLCLMVAVLIDVSWFTDGGSQGSIGFFYFLGPLLAMILLRGGRRLALLALLVMNGFALVLLDHHAPHWVTSFSSPRVRMLDFLTTVPGSILACALLLHVVLSSFDRERRRLEQLWERHQESLSEIQTLRGLLPICASCKKIREDGGLWTQVEQYISHRSGALFTHSLCPECEADLRAEFEAQVPDPGPGPGGPEG